MTAKKKYNTINIHHISKECGFQKDKIYNVFSGRSPGLTEEEKDAIFKVVFPDVKNFLRDVCGKRITILADTRAVGGTP